jgi:hypothetical protein
MHQLILLVIVLIFTAVQCATTTTPTFNELDQKLPWSLETLTALNKVNKLNTKQQNNDYPIWPGAFNCTLQKINPDDHNVQWTKLYYDWNNNRTTFIFFDWYMDTDGFWGEPNYRIYFIGTTIWFDYPKDKNCYVRARNIPTISPDWLKYTVYEGRGLWREMWADLWKFPEGMGPLTGIKYYHRVSTDGTQDTKIPLRSTNQQGDPGVTDYTDFVVGAQHDANFVLPSYCPK